MPAALLIYVSEIWFRSTVLPLRIVTAPAPGNQYRRALATRESASESTGANHLCMPALRREVHQRERQPAKFFPRGERAHARPHTRSHRGISHRNLGRNRGSSATVTQAPLTVDEVLSQMKAYTVCPWYFPCPECWNARIRLLFHRRKQDYGSKIDTSSTSSNARDAHEG